MTFEETRKNVVRWATERYIFSKEHGSSAIRQHNKLEEEFKELGDAIRDNNIQEIVDGLGDMLVVMTLIAEFYNVNLEYCYFAAYQEIKDRKGRMINGLFVKE